MTISTTIFCFCGACFPIISLSIPSLLFNVHTKTSNSCAFLCLVLQATSVVYNILVSTQCHCHTVSSFRTSDTNEWLFVVTQWVVTIVSGLTQQCCIYCWGQSLFWWHMILLAVLVTKFCCCILVCHRGILHIGVVKVGGFKQLLVMHNKETFSVIDKAM